MSRPNSTHLLLALVVTFSLAALPVLAQGVKDPQGTGSVTVGGPGRLGD